MLNRFKPTYTHCITILFVVLALSGQVTADQMPYGQGVLWEIKAASGGASGHLFGTMHSIDPKVTTLPEPVKQVFSRARSLTIEILMTKDTPIRMARRMMLPLQQRLDQIIGADLFKRLVAIGQRVGLPVPTLRRLKPWAVSAAISIPPDERAGQAAGLLPLDQVLQHSATKRGIPVFGLETIDEQLNMFDGLPMGDQIKLLRQAIADNARVSQLVNTMKKFYFARDLGGMFRWMRRQSAGQDPRLIQIFEERMINARNLLMAERMVARLKGGRAFVAIGAAHLPGTKGVLSLLARRGYLLSRIY